MQLENLIGATNPERATGKRMASDCTHLEKRADLSERGNIPELWPGVTQALPPPSARREEDKWSREGVEGWGLLNT